MSSKRLIVALGALLLAVGACSTNRPALPAWTEPTLGGAVITSSDGRALAYRKWEAQNPRVVVIAVHGMNDYSHAFALPGEWWAAHAGVTTYAYDQRGFGASLAPMDSGRGVVEGRRWPGTRRLVDDLHAVIAAVRSAHPQTPLFVVGHSMGGSVVMAAMRDGPLGVDGVVLAAPGVWGGSRMPVFYRISLSIASALMPGKTLTGERAKRQASDNIDILRALGRDPLVIKETRLDAIRGVVRIMGEAWRASDDIGGDVLILVGDKDEIIPPAAISAAARRMCGRVQEHKYPNGWHLLFRDLDREIVFQDVVAWIDGVSASPAPEMAPQTRTHGAGPAEEFCSPAVGDQQG